MKIRDLKITSKMADKHKKTMNALYIITSICNIRLFVRFFRMAMQ